MPHIDWLDRIDPQLIDLAALAGVLLGLLALVLALAAQSRVGRLRRALRRSREDGAGLSILGNGNGNGDDLDSLRQELDRSRALMQETRAYLAESIRRVAVVRYDAFEDMGGRLSFSAALLDETGDGLVLTSINGRSETRSYAKSVIGGRGEQTLSPEEERAIAAALAAPQRGNPDSGRHAASPGR